MATNGQNNQTNDPLTLLFQSSFVEPEQNGHHQPTHEEQIEAYMAETRYLQRRSIVWGALTVLFVAALAVVFGLEGTLGNWSWSGKLPKNADAAAQRVLTISPIIVRISSIYLTSWGLNTLVWQDGHIGEQMCQLPSWYLNARVCQIYPSSSGKPTQTMPQL